MRLSSEAETSFERPAGSKKPVGFRMPGSDWTSSNDDGLYIALSDVVALEAAGAWKAAAAPKVEARRSLECIVLFVCVLCAARAADYHRVFASIGSSRCRRRVARSKS